MLVFNLMLWVDKNIDEQGEGIGKDIIQIELQRSSKEKRDSNKGYVTGLLVGDIEGEVIKQTIVDGEYVYDKYVNEEHYSIVKKSIEDRCISRECFLLVADILII